MASSGLTEFRPVPFRVATHARLLCYLARRPGAQDHKTKHAKSCSKCVEPYLKARRVATPLMASPMEVYTGDREIESRRLTSLTLACNISRRVSLAVLAVASVPGLLNCLK